MVSGYGKAIREIVILESGSLARLMGMGSMYGLTEVNNDEKTNGSNFKCYF